MQRFKNRILENYGLPCYLKYTVKYSKDFEEVDSIIWNSGSFFVCCAEESMSFHFHGYKDLGYCKLTITDFGNVKDFEASGISAFEVDEIEKFVNQFDPMWKYTKVED
jgi:hypothetical protein